MKLWFGTLAKTLSKLDGFFHRPDEIADAICSFFCSDTSSELVVQDIFCAHSVRARDLAVGTAALLVRSSRAMLSCLAFPGDMSISVGFGVSCSLHVEHSIYTL